MMPLTATPTSRRLLRTLKRAAATVVLALQASVAVLPVWEDNVAAQHSAHVDEAGKQHATQHGDANCGLCAVRAHTPMPPSGYEGIIGGGIDRAIHASQLARAVVSVAATHRSRAPPIAD